MSISENNLQPLAGELKPGQRIIKINGKMFPAGIGGNFAPGSGGIDFEGVTVSGATLLENVIAIDASGTQVAGEIPTVVPELDANVFTVDAGYVADAVELSVPAASVEEFEDTISISPGYIATTKEVTKIEYGYIDRYGMVQKLDLSGETPVDSGVPQRMTGLIFHVPENAPAAEGDVAIYLCESVDTTNKKWQGRKFSGNINDGWSLSDSRFSLDYEHTVPQTGEIYNQNASVNISRMYLGKTVEQLSTSAKGIMFPLLNGYYVSKRYAAFSLMALLEHLNTPVLVSDKAYATQFYITNRLTVDGADVEIQASSSVEFEYQGKTYYYSIVENESPILVGSAPDALSIKEMEALEAATLLLNQFFWLGGSF